MTTASTSSLADRAAQARQTLADCGQEHVLQHLDSLDASGQDQLLSQIEGIDWPEVAKLIETHVKGKPSFELPESIEAAPIHPAEPAGDEQTGWYTKAKARGVELLEAGEVAVFCVAGGQGTRLGWDGPKGTYPASPVEQKTLFQLFSETLIKAGEKYGKPVPFYVMTSPINDADTRAFFEKHDNFGLPSDQVKIFPQAMMPAIDMQTHKVLLSDKDSLALSPNGHGGSLKALWTSGAIEDMKQRGIKQISYIQVDNPLVKAIDPLFIGLHDLAGAQMSSKGLMKRDALEKVGNFAVVDGKVSVIEYSNMPDELAKKTDEQGELMFKAGSIAIHTIAVDFVESINKEGFALPWNRAEKKVPFLDEAGVAHKPESANAVKLETFVFDALPLCDKSIVLETLRTEEFGPIKNADGDGEEVNDSPAQSKRLQSNRAGRWLEAAGVSVPQTASGDADATIDLSPMTAIAPEDLMGLSDLPASIEAGTTLSR